MKKEGISLSLILIIAVTSFVSAYNGYGFSIGDFFDSIDPSTMILLCLFFIFTILIKLPLSRAKIFKKNDGTTNTAMAGLLAALISLLMIYGIYKTGFDVEELLYGIGINEELLGVIIPIILILSFIYLIFKLKELTFLIFAGLFLFIALFTDWVYEEGTLLTIGIVSIAIWVICKAYKIIKGKKKARTP